MIYWTLIRCLQNHVQWVKTELVHVWVITSHSLLLINKRKYLQIKNMGNMWKEFLLLEIIK